MATTMEELTNTISIIFKQRVANLIKTGDKGIVLYATKNAAQTADVVVKEFTSALSIDGVTDPIKAKIKQIFLGEAKKVICVTYKTTFETAAESINKKYFNWLACDIADDLADVVALAKEKNYKTVVFNIKADEKHIVNFTNPSVTDTAGTVITAVNYIPRIVGALAGLSYDCSASALTFSDLSDVAKPTVIDEGAFILYVKEDKVKVAAPVNSLTTLTENVTEDMKSITIVEGMDRTEYDIRYAFDNSYKGKYKNKYDNQSLFIGAVKEYFRQLAKLNILDPEYANTCEVDIEEQKAAWIASGKDEATVRAWDALTTKKMTYKKKLFLACDVKYLDAMEALQFTINMY